MNTVADVVDWHQVLGPILGRALPLSELKPLAESVVRHPRRAVRLSPQSSIHELPFEVERVPCYDAGYFLNTTDVRPGEFLHAAAGDYYIQDAGSMLALAMCELTPGQKVCDTCASPGGKSTGALEQLGGSGLLVANEVIGSRLAILNLALSRTGYANHLMTNLEVDRLSDGLGANFDCVIVDAPCTGQSMVVRGKQSLAAYSAAQIEHSSARQKRIIRAAAKLVKPGGRLVYSTCTFSYAENELIVLDFLEEQPLWAPKRWEHLARWETPGFDGCYRLWPHRDQCAGAFAATLIRSPQAVLHEPGTAAIPRGRQVWNSLTGVPPQIDWLDEGWSSTGQ